MYCRCRNRKRLLTVVISLIGLFLVSLLWRVIKVVENSHCSEENSRYLFDQICHQYKNGQIIGRLCSPLCDSKTITYEKCTNYKQGKTVIFVQCKGECVIGKTVQAVLKSKYPDIHEFTREYLTDVNTLPESIDDFRQMIQEAIFENIGVKQTWEDIIKTVFDQDYQKYLLPKTKEKSRTFFLSLWALVQQTEYLLSKLHQDNSMFPVIYSTCGSFYLMESSPPGNILDPALLPWKQKSITWRQRADLALKLLETISSMENTLIQPLHMCDMKGENFGVGQDGSIKLIDTDTVFFTSKLGSELTNDQVCYKDLDCNLFDCHGVCQPDGKCSRRRNNNNLQSLCEDILDATLPVLKNGLLRDPPKSIKKDLKIVIRECIFPSGSDQKATTETYWKLYNLLRPSTSNMLF